MNREDLNLDYESWDAQDFIFSDKNIKFVEKELRKLDKLACDL